MKQAKVYLGIDVHKETLKLASYVNQEPNLKFQKTISHEKSALRKELQKISNLGEIFCCYEAGFSGFDLHRLIEALGYNCVVVAPSLIPKKAGDRVKTDRKDAKKLAELLRASLLTPINIPAIEIEKDRALLRLRGQIQKDLIRSKHRI